jgi:FtsH-binding integral membrane protein
MEILIGMAIAGLTEIVKLLKAKFGDEASKKIVIAFVFVLSLGYTLLSRAGIIDQQTIKTTVEVLSAAIATYQLIFKPVKNQLGI